MSSKTFQTLTNSDAVVNGGSLQALAPKLNDADRRACQISQAYAQSYIKFKPGKDEAIVWFNTAYLNALLNLGWELSGATKGSKGITFDRHISHSKVLRLDETIMGLIKDKKLGASKQEIDYVRSTMRGLENFSDSTEQMKMWDTHARDKHASGKLGNFQILPCEKDSQGTLTMLILGVVYMSQKSKGRFLWYSWDKGDITVLKAAIRIQLKKRRPTGFINTGSFPTVNMSSNSSVMNNTRSYSGGTKPYTGREYFDMQLPSTTSYLASKGIDLIRDLPLA